MPAEIVGLNPTRGYGRPSVVNVVCCHVDRSTCDELITRPEEPTDVVRRCVKTGNLVNDEALDHWGAVAPKEMHEADFTKGVENKCTGNHKAKITC